MFCWWEDFLGELAAFLGDAVACDGDCVRVVLRTGEGTGLSCFGNAVRAGEVGCGCFRAALRAGESTRGGLSERGFLVSGFLEGGFSTSGLLVVGQEATVVCLL